MQTHPYLHLLKISQLSSPATLNMQEGGSACAVRDTDIMRRNMQTYLQVKSQGPHEYKVHCPFKLFYRIAVYRPGGST